MLLKADKNKARQKRHLRVRNHIAGTTARPRLNVYRSLANIYAQVIDDEKGVTIVSASTQDKVSRTTAATSKQQKLLVLKSQNVLLKKASAKSYSTAAVMFIMAVLLPWLRPLVKLV